MKILFDSDEYTDPGSREENEDVWLIAQDDDCGILALVSDGLGSHGGGKQASEAAKDALYRCFQESRITEPEELNVWFQEANQRVLSIQTEEIKMKTTLVALLISEGMAYWAHVGDSRLYHFKDGKLVFQTFDHSVSQMAVLRGEISQEDIRGHVDRNRLIRALGKSDTIKIDVSEKEDLSDGNHAFLLCTDGFWEYVTEAEMEEDLNKCNSASDWLKHMKLRLDNRTAGSSHDNNTAITLTYRIASDM